VIAAALTCNDEPLVSEAAPETRELSPEPVIQKRRPPPSTGRGARATALLARPSGLWCTGARSP
jgi:hypothetical protein